VTRPMIRLTLLLGLLAALATASPAEAASRNQIIKDCADDGRLQGSYTKSELRDARQNLPSDVAEYTDCADVLRRAELPDGGSGGGAPGGTGTTGGGTAPAGGSGGELLGPTSEADYEELARAAKAGAQPVSINGESIVPGASGLAPGAARNGIPGPLLVVLILLAAGIAAIGVPSVRRLLPSILRRGR